MEMNSEPLAMTSENLAANPISLATPTASESSSSVKN
jgi:hypothetical protein